MKTGVMYKDPHPPPDIASLLCVIYATVPKMASCCFTTLNQMHSAAPTHCSCTCKISISSYSPSLCLPRCASKFLSPRFPIATVSEQLPHLVTLFRRQCDIFVVGL